MRKIVLGIIVTLIVICSGIIIYISSCDPDASVLEIGTFTVLSLTLIALVFYSYGKNMLALIGQSSRERESVLNTTYEMLGTNDQGGAGRIVFRIYNPLYSKRKLQKT